jgi:hypothetical protein
VNKYASEKWKLCTEAINDAWYAHRTIGIDMPGGRRVCDLSPLFSEEMRDELGRLICSAPDGYALAMAVIDWYDSGAPYGARGMFKLARALIQKADGHE